MEEAFVQQFISFIKPLFSNEKHDILAKNLIHALHAKSMLIDQTLASLSLKLDQCWHAILLKALVVACGNEPDEWAWSSDERPTKRSRPEPLERLCIVVHVKNIHGKTFTFRMRGNDTVYNLEGMVSISASIPRDTFRLVCAGKRLNVASSTLDELQISDGAIIHLVQRFGRC